MSTMGNNLAKINEQMSGISDYLDAKISNFEGNSQTYIDEAVQRMEDDTSVKLNKIKDVQIVPPLHAQYENALSTIAILQPLIDFNLSLDLQVLLDAIELAFGIITAPYQPAVDFITELAPEVITLGNNIQTLATYQPVVPGVTVPQFDIAIDLTLQDIIDG